MPPLAIVALIVVGGLAFVGLVLRPQLGGSPAPTGQATTGVRSSVQPSAAAPLIVGLTILSPNDGQAVASKEVMVIGTAPPGVSVTQDVSFGLDQHSTVDGTGHWAIKVSLNEGENKITFRIGDDQTTRQTIRVTYTPPSR